MEWPIREFLSTIAIVISVIAMVVSIQSARKTSRLQAKINAQNNQKQWLRAETYAILDDLYELCVDYFSTSASDSKTARSQLDIHTSLDKLESNAEAIGCDISMERLRDIVTGGEFELMSRKALKHSDGKFVKISLECQNIRNRLISVDSETVG